MQNQDIAFVACTAAVRLVTPNGVPAMDYNPFATDLYSYCRARNFPPAEQLARQAAKFCGQVFSADAWQSNEPVRASFEVFRAVAQALEPFWEPDSDEAEDCLLTAGYNDKTLAQIKAALATQSEAAPEAAIPEADDQGETPAPEQSPDSSAAAKSGKTKSGSK